MTDENEAMRAMATPESLADSPEVELAEVASGDDATTTRLVDARAAVIRRLRGGASPRLAAALVTLCVLLAVLSIVQWRRANGLAGDATARRQVMTTAGAFGEALLSYNFSELSDARDRVLRYATKRFGSQYAETFRAGLQTIITRLEASAEATLRDVYVTEIDGDDAKAIVVLDSKVRSSAGVRELIGSYLEMVLKRESGAWKVDAVTAVAAASDTVKSPAPSPSATGENK